MKAFVIAGVLFVILASITGYLIVQRTGYTWFVTETNSGLPEALPPPLSFDQAVVYQCSDGSTIAAAFKTGDTSVLELSLPNTNPLLLTATEAASGAKYRSDTGLVFWEQAGEALVENETGVLFARCVVRTPSTIVNDVAPTITDELVGTQWLWVETTFATGTAVKPNNPDDFTLAFSENNRFSANTDCNNIGGGYTGGVDGALSFREMVATLMACEGEVQEGVFSSQLNRVVSYRVVADTLVLSLKSDDENGEMTFTQK